MVFNVRINTKGTDQIGDFIFFGQYETVEAAHIVVKEVLTMRFGANWRQTQDPNRYTTDRGNVAADITPVFTRRDSLNSERAALIEAIARIDIELAFYPPTPHQD